VSRPARPFPWLSGSVGGQGRAGQGRAHTSTQNPHVTLAMTPVIALARSDAIMTAASATSDSIGRRRSKVPLLASAKNFSGDPADRGMTSRIPCGSSSAAKLRYSPYRAARDPEPRGGARAWEPR